MAQKSTGSFCFRPFVILLAMGFFLLTFVISLLDFTSKTKFDSDVDMCQSFVNMEIKFSSADLNNLKDIAEYCVEIGKNAEAIQILTQAHKIQTEEFGPENAETVETLGILAHQHVILEKYDQGLSLYWQVYKIQERTFGPTHPDTLNTLQNLAHVYHLKGKFEKALGFLRVVYKERKRLLGPEHLDTVEILLLLGSSLRVADKGPETTQKVLKYYGQVYKVYSRTWGQVDKTLVVLAEMTKCLVSSKRYEEAIPILQKIMKAKEQDPQSKLYEDSETLLSFSLTELGQTEEARQVHKKSRRAKSKVGKEIPEYTSKIGAGGKFTLEIEDQINAVLNLVKVAMAEGNWEKALQKLEEVYSIIESDHPKTEQVLRSLMKVHDALGNFKKAFEFSIQHFQVVRKYSNAETSEQNQNEKMGDAWDNVFLSYTKMTKERPDEAEKSLSPKLKEMAESFVGALENRKEEEKDPVVLKSLAIAAIFLGDLEIALPAASKLIRILKSIPEAESKLSEEEMEKIDTDMTVLKTILDESQSCGGGGNFESQNQLYQHEL